MNDFQIAPITFAWVVKNQISGMAEPTIGELSYIQKTTNIKLIVTTTEGPLEFKLKGLDFLHVPILGKYFNIHLFT